MKKKEYLRPAMKVVGLVSATLLDGSVTAVDGGDSGIGYGGGGSGPARGKESIWDDYDYDE